VPLHGKITPFAQMVKDATRKLKTTKTRNTTLTRFERFQNRVASPQLGWHRQAKL
jgi:hypothetical protein